jgi:hypothetical protein
MNHSRKVSPLDMIPEPEIRHGLGDLPALGKINLKKHVLAGSGQDLF